VLESISTSGCLGRVRNNRGVTERVQFTLAAELSLVLNPMEYGAQRRGEVREVVETATVNWSVFRSL